MVDIIRISVVLENETKVSVANIEVVVDLRCLRVRYYRRYLCRRTRLMHGGDDLISYNMSKKTDGDLNGEIQLHKMKPQEHFIEAQVQEGDTLQAIALRFYCSVSILLFN